jgi:signal transduction histidine kinase
LPNANSAAPTQLQQIMNYAADLELEVDRLRRRDQFLQREAANQVRQLLGLCQDPSTLSTPAERLVSIAGVCHEFSELLRDLSEPPGYHPAFDQVIDIALRPLAEQAFRSQERLSGTTEAIFRLDLQQEHVRWFPARLRHILDNLISNALRYSDPAKGEVRVGLTLRVSKEGYELRVTDNGLGFQDAQASGVLELFYRSAPTRAAGLGVGLAVVQLLVEQCCGTVAVTTAEGQGTNVRVLLPRYDLDDHVESPARES